MDSNLGLFLGETFLVASLVCLVYSFLAYHLENAVEKNFL